jgi:biopolymer transport protein ExbD
MAARARRLRKTPAHLEITAFINLIVVLVPFLLSTAVFSRLAVIDLSLPAPSSGVAQLQVNKLQLEVVLHADAVAVSDRVGGLIQRIPHLKAEQAAKLDVATLHRVIEQLKARFPEQTDATVLAQPDTPYDTLVQVMDAVRAGHLTQGGALVRGELFPNISIGDAPVAH